jgi:hypothetical protein
VILSKFERLQLSIVTVLSIDFFYHCIKTVILSINEKNTLELIFHIVSSMCFLLVIICSVLLWIGFFKSIIKESKKCKN